MSEHHKPRAVTSERVAERFDTGGKTFEESLRLVLTGGRDDESSESNEPEADHE
jgi:hypothetical protein